MLLEDEWIRSDRVSADHPGGPALRFHCVLHNTDAAGRYPRRAHPLARFDIDTRTNESRCLSVFSSDVPSVFRENPLLVVIHKQSPIHQAPPVGIAGKRECAIIGKGQSRRVLEVIQLPGVTKAPYSRGIEASESPYCSRLRQSRRATRVAGVGGCRDAANLLHFSCCTGTCAIGIRPWLR